MKVLKLDDLNRESSINFQRTEGHFLIMDELPLLQIMYVSELDVLGP